MRTISARRTGKKGSSGRVGLSGMAFGDMEFFPGVPEEASGQSTGIFLENSFPNHDMFWNLRVWAPGNANLHRTFGGYWGLRIRFWPPPPTPDFLGKNFCPGLGRKFLPKRTCYRGKHRSHCGLQGVHFCSKGKQVSLVRIHFSHPASDGKSTDRR